jgi:hypothetical protein
MQNNMNENMQTWNIMMQNNMQKIICLNMQNMRIFSTLSVLEYFLIICKTSKKNMQNMQKSENQKSKLRRLGICTFHFAYVGECGLWGVLCDDSGVGTWKEGGILELKIDVLVLPKQIERSLGPGARKKMDISYCSALRRHTGDAIGRVVSVRYVGRENLKALYSLAWGSLHLSYGPRNAGVRGRPQRFGGPRLAKIHAQAVAAASQRCQDTHWGSWVARKMAITVSAVSPHDRDSDLRQLLQV